MRLIPFELHAAPYLCHWFVDADDVERVVGERRYPVTPIDFLEWRQGATDCYLLVGDDGPVAYGEIRVDDAEDDLEIGHILVAPDYRRHRAGGIMIASLVEAARRSYRFPEVWLRVTRGHDRDLSEALENGFVAHEPASGQRFLWLRRNL